MSLDPSELTDSMETAFGVEWAARKKSPPPPGGSEDRMVLFAAVARGLLDYLKTKQDETLKGITFAEGGTEHTAEVKHLELDYEG